MPTRLKRRGEPQGSSFYFVQVRPQNLTKKIKFYYFFILFLSKLEIFCQIFCAQVVEMQVQVLRSCFAGGLAQLPRAAGGLPRDLNEFAAALKFDF